MSRLSTPCTISRFGLSWRAAGNFLLLRWPMGSIRTAKAGLVLPAPQISGDRRGQQASTAAVPSSRLKFQSSQEHFQHFLPLDPQVWKRREQGAAPRICAASRALPWLVLPAWLKGWHGVAPLSQTGRRLAARAGIAFPLTLSDPAIISTQDPCGLPASWLRMDFHPAWITSAQGLSLHKKNPRKQVLNTRYPRPKLVVFCRIHPCWWTAHLYLCGWMEGQRGYRKGRMQHDTERANVSVLSKQNREPKRGGNGVESSELWKNQWTGSTGNGSKLSDLHLLQGTTKIS